jgi:hypothetical protein
MSDIDRETYGAVIKITAKNTDIYAYDVESVYFEVPSDINGIVEDNEYVDEVFSEVVRNSDGVKLIKYAAYIGEESANRLNGLAEEPLEREVYDIITTLYNEVTSKEKVESWSEFTSQEDEVDEEIREHVRKQRMPQPDSDSNSEGDKND